MPTTYKILGQAAPLSGIDTKIYTAPSQVILSSITVCNRGSSIANFRVRFAIGGAGVLLEQYLYYDVPIAEYDTFIATVGITLNTSDEIYVMANGLGGNNLSFQIFGSEIS